MMKHRLRAAGERYFLKMDEDTLNFLVPRLELSYEAAETVAGAISAAVTQTGRGPTIPLVRETLLALAKWGVLPQTPDAASLD
jgi:chromosomal replication initiation ATPase DnaA